MKKLLLLSVLACIFLTQLNAQKAYFGRGEKVLNIGVGLGSTWYSGTYYSPVVPPISATFEFGVAEHILEKGMIGVGPYICYSSFKYEYKDGGYKYSIILTGLRGNFHYPMVDRLDTYASVFLGYNIVGSQELGIASGPPEPGGLKAAFFIGGRYYFIGPLAAMAEIGYGITYLNLGLAYRF